MRGYTQLTRDERYQIYALRKAGHSQKEIAEVLGRSPSTISRELRRNKGLKGYRPEQAHRLAQNRKKERDRTRIPKSTWARVEQLLREDWSPEQVSGWLAQEEGTAISHEWIYWYVYEDKRRGGDLHRHLRCQKPRRKRYGHYDRRGQIRERVSIDERPEVVEARSRIGDWEADTVIGKPGGAVLVTLVERRSRERAYGRGRLGIHFGIGGSLQGHTVPLGNRPYRCGLSGQRHPERTGVAQSALCGPDPQ